MLDIFTGSAKEIKGGKMQIREIQLNKNKKGQMIIIQMLFLFMTVAVMVALLPALKSILDVAQQSDNLNCPDFDYNHNGAIGDTKYDYNSSLSTDTTSCIAIKLYIPYIVLVVLIAGVSKMVYGRTFGQSPDMGGF